MNHDPPRHRQSHSQYKNHRAVKTAKLRRNRVFFLGDLELMLESDAVCSNDDAS
jgi:hypothetical protein